MTGWVKRYIFSVVLVLSFCLTFVTPKISQASLYSSVQDGYKTASETIISDTASVITSVTNFFSNLFGFKNIPQTAAVTNPQPTVVAQTTSAPAVTSTPIIEPTVTTKYLAVETSPKIIKQIVNVPSTGVSQVQFESALSVFENRIQALESRGLGYITVPPDISSWTREVSALSSGSFSKSLTVSSMATSTFASSINVISGCFAINGVCVTGIGGAATWGAITGTLSDQTDLQNALNGKLSLSSWYATTTDGLAQGSTNKYYSSALFDSDFAGKTTTNLAEGSNLYFTNARVDDRINATSTIGTILSLPNLTALGTITSGTWNGTRIGVGYGGTGLAVSPSYGQVLLGNASGGYDLVATSSLGITSGISSQWTTTGNDVYYDTGNVGIGTTSPYAKLSVVGDVIANSFVATSTTATSTFSGGLSVAGSAGLTVLQNGKVGIGNSAPTSNLYIKAVDPVFDISNTGDSGKKGYIGYSNTTFEFGTQASDVSTRLNRFGISQNGVVGSMTGNFASIPATFRNILDDGSGNASFSSNVGVGTSSPFAKLSVGGDAYVGGNITATGTINVGTISALTNAVAVGTGNFGFSLRASDGTRTYFTGNPYGSTAVSFTGTPSSNITLGVNGTSFFNGNVGIGTATPATEFAVSGTSTITGNVSLSSASQIVWPGTLSRNMIYSSAPNQIDIVGVNSGIHVNRSGIGDIYFDRDLTVAAANKAVFNGNVGIGTSSPYAKLSVVGNIVADNFISTSTTSTTTFAGGFSAAGSSGLTVLQNGNVGIGTQSPSQKLYVNGNIMIPFSSHMYFGDANHGISAAAGSGMTISDLNALTINSPTTVSGNFTAGPSTGLSTITLKSFGTADSIQLQFKQGSTVKGQLAFGGSNQGNYDTYFDYQGNLYFHAGYQGATSTVITSTGNVGIGTTSVLAKLHVETSAGASSPAIRAQNSGGGDSSSAVANFVGYNQTGVETTRISVGGNFLGSGFKSLDKTVGLDMISGSRLNVTGSVWLTTNGSGIQFKSSDGAKNKTVSLSDDGTFNMPIGTYADSWSTNNVAFAIKTPGGGNRTTFGNFGNLSINMSNSNSGTGWDSTDVLSVNIDPASSFTGRLATFSVSSVEKAAITASGGAYFAGNVGIGTTSPFATLSVNNSAGTPGFVVGSSTATNFIVDKNGNVGIGTANPTAPFSITESGLSITMDANFAGGGSYIDVGQVGTINGSGGVMTYGAKGRPLVLGIGSNGTTGAVTVQTSGNVGIGTSTPNWNMQVAGSKPYFALTDTSAGTDLKHWFMSSQGGNFYIGTSSDALNSTSTDFMLNPNLAVVGLGYNALKLNTGADNIAIGNNALSANVNDTKNIAIGTEALMNVNETCGGASSIAIGYRALKALTGTSCTGHSNVAIGENALSVGNRAYNVAIGANAGSSAAGGSLGEGNTLVGFQSGYRVVGNNNVGLGNYTLSNLGVSSNNNTAVGYNSMTTGGSNNTLLGYYAGSSLGSSASNNILIGYQVATTTSGSNNIAIGYNIRFSSTTGSNQLNIGNLIFGNGIDGQYDTVSSGKIGIGTSTNLIKPLTINGAIGTVAEGDIFSQYDGNTGTTYPIIARYWDNNASYPASTYIFGNGINSRVGIEKPGSQQISHFQVRAEKATFDGNVGIGTTSPASTLTVTGSACISVGAGATAACSTTAGTITANVFNTANADLAERYKVTDTSIEAGDVVMLDDTQALTVKKASPPSKGGVAESRGGQILGVISTAPGFLLGSTNLDDAVTRPVALAGRVPVKVSMEGGEIKIGDYLTISSTPGVAMKAGTSTRTIIGTALESASVDGKVHVFVRSSLAQGINLDSNEAIQTELVKDNSSLLSDFNALIAGSSQWMQARVTAATGFFKNIFAGSITTKKLKVLDGIDMTDKQTGEPYCLMVSGGVLQQQKGTCDNPEQIRTTVQNDQQQTQDSTSTTTNELPPVTIEPVATSTVSVSTTTSTYEPIDTETTTTIESVTQTTTTETATEEIATQPTEQTTAITEPISVSPTNESTTQNTESSAVNNVQESLENSMP